LGPDAQHVVLVRVLMSPGVARVTGDRVQGLFWNVKGDDDRSYILSEDFVPFFNDEQQVCRRAGRANDGWSACVAPWEGGGMAGCSLCVSCIHHAPPGMHVCPPPAPQALKAFQFFDRDNDGSINLKEMKDSVVSVFKVCASSLLGCRQGAALGQRAGRWASTLPAHCKLRWACRLQERKHTACSLQIAPGLLAAGAQEHCLLTARHQQHCAEPGVWAGGGHALHRRGSVPPHMVGRWGAAAVRIAWWAAGEPLPSALPGGPLGSRCRLYCLVGRWGAAAVCIAWWAAACCSVCLGGYLLRCVEGRCPPPPPSHPQPAPHPHPPRLQGCGYPEGLQHAVRHGAGPHLCVRQQRAPDL